MLLLILKQPTCQIVYFQCIALFYLVIIISPVIISGVCAQVLEIECLNFLLLLDLLVNITKQRQLEQVICAAWCDFPDTLPRNTSPQGYNTTKPEASWTFAISMVTGTTLAFASRQHWSCRHHIWLQSISCAAVNLTRMTDLCFF